MPDAAEGLNRTLSFVSSCAAWAVALKVKITIWIPPISVLRVEGLTVAKAVLE